MKSKIIISAILLALSSLSFAQQNQQMPSPQQQMQNQGPNNGEKRPMMNPENREAFKACREQTEKNENGRPEREAMKSCLQAKGVQLPPRHEGGEGREHPKMNPEHREAFKTCFQQAKKDGEGKPDREAVKSCLKAKGINPPPRPEGERNKQHPPM